MSPTPAPALRLGVMFDRDRRPEELGDFARALDALPVDDLWVVEDLGWAGSVASATIALAATSRLRVGIGIAPAPLRNPALLAMELATLARVFPGRLVAGLGHGVVDWMRRVGAPTRHRLALLEETIVAVRSLLCGETVDVQGVAIRLDDVGLVHPPAVAPPVVAGVVRQRSLELAGRVADGTVIAEGHGPTDLRAALGHIARGRAAGAPDRPHEVIVFAYLCVDDDPERVRGTVTASVTGQAKWLGVTPDEVFRLAGSAAQVAAGVRTLWDAGAHTVVLRPLGDDPVGQVRATLGALDRPEPPRPARIP